MAEIGEKLFITTVTVTRDDGTKKTFAGPFLYAYDYQEASYQAKELRVDIVGEFNIDTMERIIH